MSLAAIVAKAFRQWDDKDNVFLFFSWFTGGPLGTVGKIWSYVSCFYLIWNRAQVTRICRVFVKQHFRKCDGDPTTPQKNQRAREKIYFWLYLNLRTIRTSNGKSNSFERCADSQWISEASSKEPKVHFRVFFSVLQILQNMTRAANCSRPGLKSTPRRLLRRGKWSSSRLCGMESHVLYFCIFVFCKFWKWSIFRLCRMESHGAGPWNV